MTDDEIRSLVRVAIQKHLGSSTFAPSSPADRPAAAANTAAPPPADVVSGFSRTAPLSISFGRYELPRAADDTMCLIEPAVRCNHCGYCQCHGH